MLETYHDCNRLVTIIIIVLFYLITWLMIEWPTITHRIERKRRAKRRQLKFNAKEYRKWNR